MYVKKGSIAKVSFGPPSTVAVSSKFKMDRCTRSIDSGFDSSSSKSSTSTTNSSMHCPVWTWKVDRMWDLQQKLEKQKSMNDKDEGQGTMEHTNYFMESLKFGADLQSNFLPQNSSSSQMKEEKIKDCDDEKKSLYMFDYNTKNSNYF